MIGGNSPWFATELKRRIETEIANKSMDLGRGVAQDYADYRYAVGYLAGLNAATETAENIVKEMDSR